MVQPWCSAWHLLVKMHVYVRSGFGRSLAMSSFKSRLKMMLGTVHVIFLVPTALRPEPLPCKLPLGLPLTYLKQETPCVYLAARWGRDSVYLVAGGASFRLCSFTRDLYQISSNCSTYGRGPRGLDAIGAPGQWCNLQSLHKRSAKTQLPCQEKIGNDIDH